MLLTNMSLLFMVFLTNPYLKKHHIKKCSVFINHKMGLIQMVT